MDSFHLTSCFLFFLKGFIKFGTVLLLLYVFFFIFWPQGIWDLSSLTRYRTRVPCIERGSLNHWTTREVPYQLLSKALVLTVLPALTNIPCFPTFLKICDIVRPVVLPI